MIKHTFIAALVASIAAASAGSAKADWRDDAMLAAGMATVAAGTASALADSGYGYRRSTYRPRPTDYRVRPVSDCCYERIQWRRVPAYEPY